MEITNKVTINSCSLICVDCVDASRAIKSIEICKSKCNFSDIKLLTSLDNEYEHSVKIETIKDKRQYSYFMIKKLVDYISTDHILIIQHDSWIVDEQKWNNNWYKYDYMGPVIPAWGDEKGGNGGFSFRSKNLLIEGKRIIDDSKCHAEDVAYSGPPSLTKYKGGYSYRNEFEKLGFNYATNEENISFGGIHCRKYRGSFGHHRAWGIK